ncbi:hypothetical protein [Gallaecimonas sp. GXIMD4217]|uniref:DUF6916 family protein n=1 Tax=Gallaecimonas sp. GXIMD4217 TaxID=3131927 RepID=UPI00311ACC51
MDDQLVRLEFSAFKQMEGDQVSVSDDAGTTLTLQVDEVVDCSQPGSPFVTFVIRLSGDPDMPVPQGVYRFSHPAIGCQALLCVPNSPTDYEIVISQARQGAAVPSAGTAHPFGS